MALTLLDTLKPFGGVDFTEYFGYSVHCNGDYLAVGQPIHGVGALWSVGAVSMYKWVAGAWVLQQIIEPPVLDQENNLQFGLCVRLSGSSVAISAIGATVAATNDAGAVYVYVTLDGGATWSLQQKVVQAAPVASYFFGYSVALQDDILAIGYLSDVPLANCGAVDVWDRAAGVWAYTETVQATVPLLNSRFGSEGTSDSSIAILDDVLAICSAPSGINAAALHIFRRAGVYGLEQKLDNPTSATHDLVSVAMATDLIVCGDPDLDGVSFNSGGFHVAKRAGGVWSWTQAEGCPVAFDVVNGYMGFSVCLSPAGTSLMVGAPGAELPGAPAGACGAAFAYEDTGTGTFTYVDYGYPNVVAYVGGHGIGYHTSGHFAVGARDHDNNVDGQGAVFCYEVAAPVPTPEVATLSSLGCSFYVGRIDYVATPTPRVAFNPFDEHGLLLGLPRLRGEDNVSYRRRLLDVMVHRANSTYNGLVYGATRELGLSLFYAMRINPRLTPAGLWTCGDPLIKFDGIYLYLYSDYYSGMLDYQIDRCELGGNWEHLCRLRDYINTSSNWEASIETGVDQWTRSMTILNQTNRVYIPQEPIPVTNHFQLEHYPIARHTLFFSDRTIFDTEVNLAADVTDHGDYWVDYQTGIVFVYDLPVAGASARYEYYLYPFKAIASPIIIHDINDNFRRKMFKQELQDDNTYADSTPTRVGVDIINELYSLYPAYWGR